MVAQSGVGPVTRMETKVFRNYLVLPSVSLYESSHYLYRAVISETLSAIKFSGTFPEQQLHLASPAGVARGSTLPFLNSGFNESASFLVKQGFEINNHSTRHRTLGFYKTYKKKKKHNTITKACHTLCFFFVSLRNIYKQAYVQIAITQK